MHLIQHTLVCIYILNLSIVKVDLELLQNLSLQ